MLLNEIRVGLTKVTFYVHQKDAESHIPGLKAARVSHPRVGRHLV